MCRAQYGHLHKKAEIILTITPEPNETTGLGGTAADLVRSPLFGIWADREDIEDSLAYARWLRTQAESRHLD